MVIRTNKKPSDGIGARSVYYIWKAIQDLGHTALCRDDMRDDISLVLDVDGAEPTGRIEGVPYFYWDCDSFFHGLPENKYDQIFIGGAPEDLERYPEGTVFLPHAFDPETIYSLGDTKEFDIVMAGTMNHMYDKRMKLVSKLREYFSVVEVQTADGADYNKALNSGKLIFNVSLGENNIPMRFFEGMAVGALLCNDTGNLDAFATPYTHFIPFKNDAEMIGNALIYLKNDAKRLELSHNAQTHALENHTYKHRVETILSYL